MAKRNQEIDLLEGFAWVGGLATLLEVGGFMGDLLDKMSESARHELVDALASSRIGQAYRQAMSDLGVSPERPADESVGEQ